MPAATILLAFLSLGLPRIAWANAEEASVHFVANRATFTLRAPGASGFHALTALPTMGLTFSYLAGTESAP